MTLNCHFYTSENQLTVSLRKRKAINCQLLWHQYLQIRLFNKNELVQNCLSWQATLFEIFLIKNPMKLKGLVSIFYYRTVWILTLDACSGIFRDSKFQCNVQSCVRVPPPYCRWATLWIIFVWENVFSIGECCLGDFSTITKK